MLNRVVLIGRLGADPELRYTPSGQPVCSFRIAVNRFKTKAQREQNLPPVTDWFPIVVWGQPAVFCSEYLRKGKLVSVDGRMQNRSWDDQSGQKRVITEVVAENVQFLSPRNEGAVSGAAYPSGGGGYAANSGGGFPSGGGYAPSGNVVGGKFPTGGSSGEPLGSEIGFPDDELPF